MKIYLLVILFAGRGGAEGQERGRGRGDAAHSRRPPQHCRAPVLGQQACSPPVLQLSSPAVLDLDPLPRVLDQI